MKTASKVLLATFAAAAAGCGDHDPLEGNRFNRNEDRGSALVLRYCSYGATSVPDLEACLRRTTPDEVRRDDSNAGRYATGEVGRCRVDAGPYCAAVGP